MTWSMDTLFERQLLPSEFSGTNRILWLLPRKLFSNQMLSFLSLSPHSFDNLFSSPPPVSLLSNSGRYGPSSLNGCLPVVSQLFQSNHSSQSGFNHHSAAAAAAAAHHHHHPHHGMQHFANSHFSTNNNPSHGSSSLAAHNSLGMNLKSSAAAAVAASADPNNNSMDVEKLDLNRSSTPRTACSSPANHKDIEKQASVENNHTEDVPGDQHQQQQRNTNSSPSEERGPLIN